MQELFPSSKSPSLFQTVTSPVCGAQLIVTGGHPMGPDEVGQPLHTLLYLRLLCRVKGRRHWQRRSHSDDPLGPFGELGGLFRPRAVMIALAN